MASTVKAPAVKVYAMSDDDMATDLCAAIDAADADDDAEQAAMSDGGKAVGIVIRVTASANDALKEKAKAKGWPVNYYVLSLVYADTGDSMPELPKRGRAARYVNADGTPMSKEQIKAAKAEEKAEAEKVMARMEANESRLLELRAMAEQLAEAEKTGGVIDVAALLAKLRA